MARSAAGGKAVNAMNREVYSLVEITRTLLDMRDNCIPKEGDTYDDPRRSEKYAALNAAIDLINNPSLLVNGDASDGEMSNWISVKERLPEAEQKVLVCGKRNGMQVGAFRGLMCLSDPMGWWWKKETRLDVTYWMPLPEPPGEDE